MREDLLKIKASHSICHLHTHRLQRSNHSGRVRMRGELYVEDPDDDGGEGHFTETLFNMTTMFIHKIFVYTQSVFIDGCACNF